MQSREPAAFLPAGGRMVPGLLALAATAALLLAAFPPAGGHLVPAFLSLGLFLLFVLALVLRAPGQAPPRAGGAEDARLRELLELSSDWYWEQDAEFRFTHMSGGVFNKGHFRIADALGRRRWELPIVGVGEEEWARHRAQLERHEPFHDFTYRIRAADGRLRWYAVSGRPVFDARGRFTGYRGIGRDITRQKEIEEALRSREAILNKAQAVARLGSWHLDLAANRLEWSEQTYRLFGLPPGTPLTYERFLACVHPADREAVDRAWRAALGGAPYDIEHRILAEGETRWVREQAEVEFDAAGRPLTATGTVLDITDRKRTERQLRLAASVFEHSLEGIVITDAGGDIVAVNRAFSEITGYGAGEVLGRNPRLLQSGHHDAAFYRAMWETIRQQGHWRGEIWNRRKNGEIYPELLGICAVPGEDGGTEHYIGLFTDISAMKRAEQTLRDFNAELERRVAERTAALEASNRELEAFSHSVSHDLRAPLRAIDGFAKILADDYGARLDDEALGHLARIRAASQRMARVMDELIELARLARLEPQRRPVDLSALARSLAAGLAADGSRRVEFSIAPQLHAHADARLLHAVLHELLHNAWKFSAGRDPAHIEFGAGEIDGERVFYVRDDGAGFDMRYAGRLFGAFQRLHRPDEFPGLGIGLARVRRIIERHGGRLWAEAAPGRGATFYFTLA